MADINYIAARVDNAHERLDKIEPRVVAIEKENAVTTERMTNIQTSLNKIETGIRSVMWWAVAAVLTPIIGAAVAFMIRGGLHG